MSKRGKDPETNGLEIEDEGGPATARAADQPTDQVIADGELDDADKKAEEALESLDAEELATAEGEGMTRGPVPRTLDQHDEEGPKENKGRGRAA